MGQEGIEDDGMLWKDAYNGQGTGFSRFTHDGLDGVHRHPPFTCVFVPVLVIARRVLREEVRREHTHRAASLRQCKKQGRCNSREWRCRRCHPHRLYITSSGAILRIRIEKVRETVLAVRMPHRGNKAHLRREQWELWREGQPCLEESSLTIREDRPDESTIVSED